MIKLMHRIHKIKEDYMRTTIDLPGDLLTEAMRLAHVKTKTMAITLGLQELINRYRLDQLRLLRGKVSLTIDLKKSRRR